MSLLFLTGGLQLMTDDSDESVGQYRNTPNKKMLYIVFNQKNDTSIMLKLQHTYYAQNYASIMCLSLLITEALMNSTTISSL